MTEQLLPSIASASRVSHPANPGGLQDRRPRKGSELTNKMSLVDTSMQVAMSTEVVDTSMAHHEVLPSSCEEIQETITRFTNEEEEEPPKKLKRITIPNAHNIPNQQEIQKGHERSESTREIDELIKRNTVITESQGAKESATEPLLNSRLSQTNYPTSTQMTTNSALQSTEQMNEPERLRQAVNRFGKPIAFDFSTSQELGGTGFCKKFVIALLILLYCAIFPALYFIGPELDLFDKTEIAYASIMYVLVFNTLLFISLGYCGVGCVAYPYSNSIFNKTHFRQSNEKFGFEFIKCTERIVRIIEDMIETQSSQNSTQILIGNIHEGGNQSQSNLDESGASAPFTVAQLTQKEIYARMASNIELIGLYLQTNEKIMNEPGSRPSRLFRLVTNSLSQIQQALDRIELKLGFAHPWFPPGKFVSFWAFYNKMNPVSDQSSEQQQNARKFIARLSLPIVVQSEQNKRNLQTLSDAVENLKLQVRSSVRKCCCFRFDNLIFGRLDQAKHILTETFDGKHFSLTGPDNNKIDCMFFPCTSKEKVIVDGEAPLNGQRQTGRERRESTRKQRFDTQGHTISLNDTRTCRSSLNSGGDRRNSSTDQLLEEPKYLSKPTIIMCNPNALYYQQMVTSPNAYWLNFFLKRDINVLCWNYRGYGESTRGFGETVSPYKCKRDAEYVMAFLINKLKVKGKVGVYGRSIGGLTACHLANKYNNLVKMLLVDRSFYELSTVPVYKAKGRQTARIFDLLSWGWRTRNHSNFVTTTNCFKIITCDPLDDTVDLFGNLVTGVASQLASYDYESAQFRQFYKTMRFVFDYENQLFEALSPPEQMNHTADVIKAIESIESIHCQRLEQENEISEELSTNLNTRDLSTDSEAKQNQKIQRISYRTMTAQSSLAATNDNDPDSQLPKKYSMSLLRTMQPAGSEFNLFRNVIHMLVICLQDLQAGTMAFSDVLGINRQPSFEEFVLFLQTMEVYGCGYTDDVDVFRYNQRNTETHSEAMAKQLRQILQCYDLAIRALDEQKDSALAQMPMYKSHYLQFLSFQRAIFRKLLAIQHRKVETVENDYHVRPEGHLVLVTCGHRGQPNRSEEKRISRLMRKSGFIPMLEDLNADKKNQEKTFDKALEQPQQQDDEDEKKTNQSLEKAQGTRPGSRGKGLMPDIKVVSQPRLSPMANIVIDVEETLSPLQNSKRSFRGDSQPKQPVDQIDEEAPDAGDDSDDNAPLIKAKAAGPHADRALSAAANTGNSSNNLKTNFDQADSLYNVLATDASQQIYSHPGSVQDTTTYMFKNSQTNGSRNNSTNNYP